MGQKMADKEDLPTLLETLEFLEELMKQADAQGIKEMTVDQLHDFGKKYSPKTEKDKKILERSTWTKDFCNKALGKMVMNEWIFVRAERQHSNSETAIKWKHYFSLKKQKKQSKDYEDVVKEPEVKSEREDIVKDIDMECYARQIGEIAQRYLKEELEKVWGKIGGIFDRLAVVDARLQAIEDVGGVKYEYDNLFVSVVCDKSTRWEK